MKKIGASLGTLFLLAIGLWLLISVFGTEDGIFTRFIDQIVPFGRYLSIPVKWYWKVYINPIDTRALVNLVYVLESIVKLSLACLLLPVISGLLKLAMWVPVALFAGAVLTTYASYFVTSQLAKFLITTLGLTGEIIYIVLLVAAILVLVYMLKWGPLNFMKLKIISSLLHTMLVNIATIFIVLYLQYKSSWQAMVVIAILCILGHCFIAANLDRRVDKNATKWGVIT